MGHRIIEINNQSVVAVPHEKIVSLLATSVGEVSLYVFARMCHCAHTLKVGLRAEMCNFCLFVVESSLRDSHEKTGGP